MQHGNPVKKGWCHKVHEAGPSNGKLSEIQFRAGQGVAEGAGREGQTSAALPEQNHKVRSEGRGKVRGSEVLDADCLWKDL